MLEEFERTLEGIGSGVKQVLAQGRGQESGVGSSGFRGGQGTGDRASPWSLVRGVVADFVQVGVEHAAAIDVALGEAAQAVVVDGGGEATDCRAADLAGGERSWPAACQLSCQSRASISPSAELASAPSS